ncbi:MAG: winged helix-turn-helix domain-containing protein [Thiovulaceae bacterium]|nr:winged helix-turn-helix domain-containing protein [Sulfurimonadaceae bacterium]
MNKYKILIIENDEDNRSEIKLSLQNYGYQVMSINQNMSKVKNKLKNFLPDIVIIDNIVDDIRHAAKWAKYIIKAEFPCIICTDIIDTSILRDICCMELCAFFVKPFNVLSLHIMIQMTLHKFDKEKNSDENFIHIKNENRNLRQLLFGKEIVENPIVGFGKDLYFHSSTCETFYQNKRLSLTKKENLLIQLLISNMGHTINFEQIIKYVWGKTKVSENNVRTLVWRMRSKLQSDIIKTVSGVGYYIEGTLTPLQNNVNDTILSYNQKLRDSA